MAVLLGTVVSALVLASVAAATAPVRTSKTFTVSVSSPAGTFCDFNLHIDTKVTTDKTVFSDGSYKLHDTGQFTYTNLDTANTVSGTARINAHGNSSGERDTGLLLQLRDPSGKMISVNAGRITLDSNFNVIDFTPNSDPSVRAVVCPALGGSPA